MQVFITQTDHLSDRALYTVLLRDVFRQKIPLLPVVPGSAWHFDLLGGWSDDDLHTYLKYYADEDDRQRWLADFPDYQLPAHEDLPYDRDQYLPPAEY